MHRKNSRSKYASNNCKGKITEDFFNFLIGKPYNKPLVHMKPN